MAREKYADGSGKLSVLEQTVLGIVWMRGPCTIYTVMKELSTSESSYHKSRAGTAYSVAKRLVGFGLLRGAAASEKDRLVELSEEGLDELRRWIGPPVPMSEIAHSADFLRLRFFFLGAIEPEARLALVDESLAGLEVFLRKTEKLIERNEEAGDSFGVLATVSVVLETKARIRWLRLVRDWLVSPQETEGDRTAALLRIIREEDPSENRP